MPAPRSPEIITEPVVHDGLSDALDRLAKDHARDATPWSIHSPSGPRVAIGLVEAAVDLLGYWQDIGPRLARNGGNLDRAEHAATFERAFAKAGLDGWKAWPMQDGVMVTTPDHNTPPLFTATWVTPARSRRRSGEAPDHDCWYSEPSYWDGQPGAYHDTIADLIAHHAARISAAA